MGEHLYTLFQATRKWPAELRDRPEDPEPLMYLWEWYWEIRAGERRDPMSGIVEPLSYLEIDAWQRVTGNRLRGFERRVLFRLDAQRRSILSEERRNADGGAGAGGRQQRRPQGHR